jgi:cation-transporting ATPase E
MMIMSEMQMLSLKIPEGMSHIKGLTSEEISAKQAERQRVDQPKVPTIRQLIQKYLITVFNIGLFALILLQLLFNKPLDALVSALVMIFGIALNVGQETWARRRLSRLAAARPETVRVIRAGKIEVIELRDLVVDDVLVANPGDLIAADGKVLADRDFLVNESFLTSEVASVVKRKGDQVYAGSICMEGEAAYRAETMAQESRAYKAIEQAQLDEQDYSPLQKLVDRVLRLLILVVMYFGLMLVIDYFLVGVTGENRSALAGMVFSLAPNGLFFMILISYTMGAAMISGRGALIPQVTSIEALAQISALCLGKSGSLTRVNVDFKPVNHVDAEHGNTPEQTQNLIGDFARSVTSSHQAFEEIARVFPGEQRPILEEVPFSTAHGWTAVKFEHAQRPGIYVLGRADVLEPYLSVDLDVEIQPETEQRQSGTLSGLRHFFGSLLDRPKKASRKFITNMTEGELVEIIFAQQPSSSLKVDQQGHPLLPGDLIPLGTLRISEEVRQDAHETIKFFSESGVAVKLISGDEPGTVLSFAKQAGVIGSVDESTRVVNGAELATMDSTQFARSASDNIIFANLSPEQKGDLVKALRDNGEYVGVLGSTLQDMFALKEAHLLITPEAGDQGIRRFADIVLLKNSLSTLKSLFREGERIVNSLTDVFRIYLTQILYFALLIATISILNIGFPLQGKQNTIVTLVSVHLPAIGASLFAVSGATPKGKLQDMIFHFIVPAGILSAIAGFGVYLTYLYNTNSLEYTQLVTTYVLVLCGSVTVLFVEPPHPIFAGGDVYRGNRSLAIVQLILVVVFFILTPTGIGDELFGIAPLNQFLDYLIVFGVAVAYGLILKLSWRYRVFDQYMHIHVNFDGNE